MLVILIKKQSSFIKVALIVLSQISLPRCVDYLIKGIKKLFPPELLSFVNTSEF